LPRAAVRVTSWIEACRTGREVGAPLEMDGPVPGLDTVVSLSDAAKAAVAEAMRTAPSTMMK
jgi:hypothetical protein